MILAMIDIVERANFLMQTFKTFLLHNHNNQTVQTEKYRHDLCYTASLIPTGARWYNFETLSQSDNFRRTTVESVHIVQLVHIARLILS